jgi:subtilisin family serine protease
VTSDDKPKNGSGQSRPPGANRSRQTSRQGPQPVLPRPLRYMVALPPQAHPGTGGPALDADGLHRLLDGDPEVAVLRRLPMRTSGVEAGSFPAVVVADMTAEHAAALRRRLPQVHIERDRLLTYSEVPVPPRKRKSASAVPPLGTESTYAFLVRDSGGAPVPGAVVMLTGSGWPAQAVTGPDGRAAVTMVGETAESIVSVLVKPRSGHWSTYVERPALSSSRENLIEPAKLSDGLEGFPGRQVFGWGQKAMDLDRLPRAFSGAGVKIAIIDSGAATEHADLLGRVTCGIDLAGGKPDGWADDTAHHGSHCAGIIAGGDDGRGILGFAAEAEVHACKIFPGGRFSDLIEALDYCIDQRIDVINLSLGSRHSSRLVAAKIDEARRAGVACVVAAGSDGGAVGFPGNLPTVLTVAAIGKLGTFPDGTGHAAEVRRPVTGEGYFSPSFTCHGPEVDVCAPGVAVLSCVPPGTYAAWDGTSMAAPHVTGLAALVLAHHGDFRHAYGRRDARRVDHLFHVIRSSSQALDLGDPYRTGAGLPNVLRALGPALTQVTPQPEEARRSFDELSAEMVLAGLPAPAPGQAPMAGHVRAAGAFPVTGVVSVNGFAPQDGAAVMNSPVPVDGLMPANRLTPADRPGHTPGGETAPAAWNGSDPVAGAVPAGEPAKAPGPGADDGGQAADATPVTDGGIAAKGTDEVPLAGVATPGAAAGGDAASGGAAQAGQQDGQAALAWLTREMGAAGLIAGQRAADPLR